MFSELCRETLRKAAVCYSSARAGSPSPSPPTSPPPSPAKEAKTAANTDLANVRDAGHDGTRDHHHHPGTTAAGRRASPASGNATGEHKEHSASERSATTDRPNDAREYVYVRKRPAMPTDFSKRLPGFEAREGRRGGTCGAAESKESRSVSPEKAARQHEDNRGGGSVGGGHECGRSDSRLGRWSPGSSPEPEDNSSTSGDEAGAAPEETNQRSSSAHNRHSLTKEQTMHWFAQIGSDDDPLALPDVKRRRSFYDEDSLDGDRPYENEGRESTGSSKDLDRAKLVRERQNEERQRKLEELRQQALAAQRFREQREEERRRRIDELRSRDNDRRNQVEERKRLICEAERERREAILRKNQEREARIEAKRRNERSHIVFAFGSSTPRMLEPADTGGATFWGTRRATSTTNVMMFSAAQPLTRRSSERELDGSKKRATSAGGLDRKPGEGIRSGEVTPNSPSRPHSSMSQQSASSVGSSNVNLRTRTTASRRPRPASIAGTGVSVTEKHNLVGEVKLTKDSKPPLPKVHSTPKKPSTPKATEMKKPTEKLIRNARSSPRITPKATPLQSPGAEHAPFIRETHAEIIKQNENKDMQDVKFEDKNEEKKDQGSEKAQQQEANVTESVTNDTKIATEPVLASKQVKDETNLMQENLSSDVTEESKIVKKEENKQEKKSPETVEVKPDNEIDEQIDMSASMIAKIRITTEEEAKAALAERRRLAREQAEREAELERQRQEEEARREVERLRAEEEEQRRLEEETIRLANEAREAEEQRLQLAIEEAKRREEEDRRKREEEARQKQEKEEAERKAREEAERQRIEMAERLKKEEEERNARRKRVEAIMLRTRGKNQSNSSKGEGGDGDKLKEDSPSDENKPVPGGKGDDVMTASLISEATQQFISSEQRAHHTENNVLAPDIVHNGTTHSNGINENKIVLDNNQGNVEGELNGHHTNHGNGINSQSITLDNATVKQNNVTNNLLDLSDFDTLSNNSTGYNTGPILELTPNLANEDTLNSNLNPTAMPFTPMGFVPTAANANVNPFQDNFINNKPQDNNQVPDLLS
ncbi:MAP7 domain-containing protein 2 isoform X35 [Linepithema humile]|uniref:MAP7 domain-containing protein 2 isoform X35 n=1 Tax=Linepithema humile TaxID=83485 RepID=UPI00351E3DB9